MMPGHALAGEDCDRGTAPAPDRHGVAVGKVIQGRRHRLKRDLETLGVDHPRAEAQSASCQRSPG
jgi:hypothetical protein